MFAYEMCIMIKTEIKIIKEWQEEMKDINWKIMSCLQKISPNKVKNSENKEYHFVTALGNMQEALERLAHCANDKSSVL